MTESEEIMALLQRRNDMEIKQLRDVIDLQANQSGDVIHNLGAMDVLGLINRPDFT